VLDKGGGAGWTDHILSSRRVRPQNHDAQAHALSYRAAQAARMSDETMLFLVMAAMALVAIGSVAWLLSRLLVLFGVCPGRADDEGNP